MEIRRCIIPSIVHDALRLATDSASTVDFSRNIVRNAEAHPRHVNDISVAFYMTRRLNANEHNEPRVRSVGRSAKSRTDIALN